MTSKEMEARSGVPRANIRYYEAEGLLAPARAKNGYREYSEEDLAVLEKIKLLRRLGVPVEELKALRSGSASLLAVLDRRLAELSGERGTLERVEQVCGELRQAEATFESLDAGRYLAALDAPALPRSDEGVWWKAPAVPPLPEEDALPVCTSIPRRLFARLFDRFAACAALIAAMCLTETNPALHTTALSLLTPLLLLFTEPLLLHVFGTTPGKALLGLRLEGPGGEKLTYAEGLTRHILLLWYGLGLGIPIWRLIRLYLSAKCCVEGEPLPWDVDVAYTAKPFRPQYAAAFILAAALMVGGLEVVMMASLFPPHRGDLTVAEFAENFNRQAAYLDANFLGQRLDGEGKWEDLPFDGTVYSSWSDWGEEKNVPFVCTVEDGRLTKLTLSAEVRNTENWPSIPKAEMWVAVMAFAWAQEDAPFWAGERMKQLEALDSKEDVSLRQGGTAITLEIDREGFLVTDAGLMIPEEDGGENYAAFTFTIALEN